MSRELKKTLGRIGDQTDPAPTWAELTERYQSDESTWLDQWRSPAQRRRRLAIMTLAGVAALLIAGAGLWFAAGRDNGETRVDTVDQPDQESTPTSETPPSDPDQSSPSPADDDSVLPVGCFGSLPSAFGEVLLASAEADIDGDGGADRVGSADIDADDDGRTETYLWATLADGTWVISRSESPDQPSFETDWPVGRDLDGDGSDELLAFVGGNTQDRVVAYHYADCAITPVPTDGSNMDGFPIQARSAACEDVCNVGLVCLDNGDLAATETTPVDFADKYGPHTWTRTVWAYRDGRLSPSDTESGTLAWQEAGAAGFGNTVSCRSTAQSGLDDDRLEQARNEVADLAQALSADVLIATWNEPDAGRDQAVTVVTQAGVARVHDTEEHQVLRVSGDALQTVKRSDRRAGPWLDFDGLEIDCPAVDGWPEPGPYIPAQRADGTWAVLTDGTEFGDALDLPQLAPDQWWAVPRWEVDCQSGDRASATSVEGTNDPDRLLADNEMFMSIEQAGGRVIYLGGGEGIMTAITDDGRVLLDEAEVWTWALSSDGSTLVHSDFAGSVQAVDTGTGANLWSVNIGNVGGRLRIFDLGDRMVTAGENSSVSMVDLVSGDVLTGPTEYPNLAVFLVN